MRVHQLALTVTVAMAALPGVSAESTVPDVAFVEQQQFSTPRLSPDGKHLAVNVRIKRGDRTVPTMHVYTLPKLEIVNAIALPGYEIPVNFLWLTNDRLAVKKGLELGLREMPAATGEVVAVNLDGSKQEYLYGYKGFQQNSRGDRYGSDYGYGSIVHVPRSHDGHVLVGAYNWDGSHSMLYDINSLTSVRKLIADIPAKHLSFVVQNNGKPRFAYGVDDKDEDILYRLDDASGEWRLVTGPQLGKLFIPFAFTADDTAFFANYSERGGHTVVVREELATGKRTVVAQDSNGSIAELQYTAPPAVPFAAGTVVGIPKVRMLNENAPEAALYKTLSGLFPDEYVDFINFTDDGSKLLFSVSSDRDPGSYYLYDRATGKADLLMTNMPKIDPAEMAARMPIEFAARDGLGITGYLTLPRNRPGQKVPMVVMPHGGPFGVRDTWFFDPDAQFLASRGYAVLQVNYRGSSGLGKGYQFVGYREWGGKLIDDIADGIKWATGRPEIDGARVCAYGWSYGGYAALMLATRAPSLIKCAVGAGGVYSLSQIYSDDNVKGNAGVIAFFKKSMGDDENRLAAQSPTSLADKITVPVLLVHGSKDKTAPIVHAKLMRDALIKAGHPPEWMEVENEGHGFYDSEHRKEFYLKLDAFLSRHIRK